MSILIDQNTRIIIQGLSGHQAQFDTKRSLAYGSKVVAGVVPGREGQTVLGLPIYNTVEKAVTRHGANASVIYVPAQGAKDAILEAAYAGIKLIVIITEKIPLRDFSEAFHIARSRGVCLIGPNSNGIISPGKCKMGILGNAPQYFMPGPVGIVSRSGGMTHEFSNLLTRAGIGQSTCISIGGDMIIGTTFREVLQLFEQDPETHAVVMYCEPGGRMEEDAASFIRSNGFSKPVVAFVGGMFMENMPQGMPFGHAGAIIEHDMGKPSVKKKILAEAGVRVAERMAHVPELIKILIA